MLEVDLEIPKELHSHFNNLPLCPEKDTPPGSKLPKLLATLFDKKNYIIHYRNLKQAIKYGLKLVKIHKVLKFNQSPWLKEYIELNTNFRKMASNEFERALYKLLNNSIFGKTLENQLAHRNVYLKSEWEGRFGIQAYISKPSFSRYVAFAPDLVAIELKKTD